MRRQSPLAHQLYNHLFPRPTTNDPPSFSAHLARNLVPEVRIEVATFYGDLNTTEARYPGLNYCHPPHRMRLGRFKHHKRLFDAFDALGLTYNEIQEFCCWEGTKWARERYEKDEGVKVLDTTGDEIGPYVDRREVRAADEARRHSITRKTEISVIVEEASTRLRSQPLLEENDEEMSDADSEGEGGEDENEYQLEDTTGQQTPREGDSRLQQRSALYRLGSQVINQSILAAWEQGRSLPPDIEQYLKEESERGNLADLRSALANRASSSYVPLPTSATSPTSPALTGRAVA